MKKIPTTEAVGHVIPHDITRIVKDDFKGVAFKKGHIIREEDIPVLLSIGKEHIYIWEKSEGMLHEDEAAEILSKICTNMNIKASAPKEGKIELFAEADGILKIDTERLFEINSLEDIIIATRHNNFSVKKGDKLAGARVVPLVIEESKMDTVRAIMGSSSLMSLLPFQHKKVGIVTTGSEVYRGRIKDTFGPVIKSKLSAFDTELVGHEIVDDDSEQISSAIKKFISLGAELVACTGGMSVDPDDLTPLAIKSTGAEIVTYGAPVLPGAMLMLAYMGNVPIVGLPGCVMYAERTIFDLLLPRIIADDRISRNDFARMGHGGLCLSCKPCTYPHCGFGKGM